MNRRAVLSFLSGACAGAGIAVVGLAVALVLGVVPRPSLYVGAFGAVATAFCALAAHRLLDHFPFRAGGAAVAVVAAGLILAGSFGALRMALLAGGVLAAVFGPRLISPLIRPFPPWLAAAGLAMVAFVLVRAVVGGGAFGHDESAYMVKAGSWVLGTPATGWGLHRGVGQSVVAAALLRFTTAEEAFRMVAVLGTLGTVGAVAWLGTTVATRRVGIVAALVFAAGPTFLRRGAEFLTDVPSTGLLLVATVLLWKWLTGRRPRPPTLLWATAVGAVAIYVRYQSVLTLGLLAATSVALFWPRLRAEKGTVGRAAALGVLLLVPHFLFATDRTGRPWGIIVRTGEAGGRDYLGQGLVDYASEFGDLLAGPLGAVAITAGGIWIVAHVIRAISSGGLGDRSRLALFLGAPALTQILALGLISHGDPRFVFYPVALLVIAGSIAFERIRRFVTSDRAGWPAPVTKMLAPVDHSWLPAMYRAAAASFVVAFAVLLAFNGDRVERNAEARGAGFEVIVAAARAVRLGSDDQCGAITGSLPQMTWYSTCPTAPFRPDASLAPEVGPTPFLVLFEDGPRQPEGDLLDAYLALTDGEPITIPSAAGGLGDARLYRVTAP